MNKILSQLLYPGVPDNDREELQNQKSFYTRLMLFYMIGAIVWTGITAYLGYLLLALIPAGFILLVLINHFSWSSHKNFEITKGILILIGMIYPFSFQAVIGGFEASGIFMIWAFLALVGSLYFKDGSESVIWFVLFIMLSVGITIFDDVLAANASLDMVDFELILIIANLVMVAFSLFGLTFFIVQRQVKAQSQLHEIISSVKKQEEQVRKSVDKQMEDAEKLYEAQRLTEEQNAALKKSEEELKSITRKQMEINERLLSSQDEIKDQEFRFRSVVENAPLVIFTVDRDGVFTLMEGALLHKLDLRPGQLIGRNALTTFRENPNIFKGLRAALNGQDQTVVDTINNVVFENHFIPLRDSQGKVRGVLGILRDITDQNKAEEELKKALKRAKKSEESLRTIAEEQLEASEKLLVTEKQLQEALYEEKSSRKILQDTQSQLVNNEKMASLGQLTAGIAHEINNPINFVYNGIDTLKVTLNELHPLLNLIINADEKKDTAQLIEDIIEYKEEYDIEELLTDSEDLISEIRNGAVRTIEIVKGLRVFSRLDEEEQKPADVNENLDATLVLLRNRIKDRLKIKKYYDDSMTEINCYPGQLNQVFMNLLSNAIQAIPDEEKGTISIYTENRTDEVIIRIKDSGVGMPESVKKRIFEPFFTTKPVGVGTGLGLSISYGIIEKHDGQIYVESEEGKGTEFVIHLPKIKKS